MHHAQKMPDRTERTNLRKWGMGDMVFAVSRVCLDSGREVIGSTSCARQAARVAGIYRLGGSYDR
jgi:hypothetical protein